MANDIGPKIGVQGEAEFRKSISDINTNLKTLTAETKAVTSAFIGNENSMEALTAKSDVLTRKSDELNNKLDTQKQRLQEMKDAGVDPTSASYQKLQQDIYKTETELNKNEAELRSTNEAMDNLGEETDDAAESMQDLGEKGTEAGGLLKANLASQAIIGGIKALAGAIKEGVEALAEMVVNAANAADDLNTMAKTTGLSTEELQKFQYASELIDVSMDTLTGSMTKLTTKMSSAQSGTGAAAEAFNKLGVAVTNSDGSLRDRNEVFNETIAALGEIENVTERDAAAMEIFGKSAQDLNPLIMGGAEALQQLGDEAEAAGLIMSQDTLDDLNSVSDAMVRFKNTTEGLKNQLVAAFAGQISGAIEKLTGYITRLVSAFQNGDWDEISNIISEVFDEISAMALEFLPKAIEFGAKVIIGLAESIISNLPQIISTGVTILLTLIKSLTDTLPQLIPVAVEAVLTIVDTLTNPDMLSELIDAALTLIIALADGLITALPQLVAKAPEIVMNLVDTLIRNAPKILAASVELIIKLGEGLVESFFRLKEKADEIVGVIKDKIISLAYKLKEAGRELLEGLWNGISDKIEWLKGKVSGVVDTIKSWFTGQSGFDEHSPSRWAADVFEKVMEGGAKGLAAGLPGLLSEAATVTDDVRAAMESATIGMTPQINAPDFSMPNMLADTVNGIQTAMGAFTGGDIRLVIQIDGRTLAEATVPDYIAAARANGTPILNPVMV